MALLPHSNDENSFNRSKSSSFSTPIKRKIIHNEVYQCGENTLFRSYSCSQVFNKDETGRAFETTQIQIMNFLTPQKSKYVPAFKRRKMSKNKVLSEIPIECNAKTEKMVSSDTGNHSNAIKMNNCKFSFKDALKFGFLSVFTAVAAFLMFCSIRYSLCEREWNLKKVAYELNENLFGQNEAIARADEFLGWSSKAKDLHIMVLTGGVGVGKSLMSAIIAKNFPWKSNILIVKISGESDISNKLPCKFSECGYNLIRVDDLSVGDTEQVLQFILNLKKKVNNEKILLILIFNVLLKTDETEIFSKFKNSHISVFHIPFKSLGADVVEKCFLAEMQKQGVKIPPSELDKLVKNKIKHIDISKGPVGCKGISEEVSLYTKF